MLAVNYTNLWDNMKSYMDKVTDDRLIYKIDKENVYILACRYHMATNRIVVTSAN